MTPTNPQSQPRQEPNPLAALIGSLISEPGDLDTAIPSLTLYKRLSPTINQAVGYLPPSVCLIGQGSKSVVIGEESLTYDAQRYLVTTLDLPVATWVTKATSQRPYLALRLTLERQTMIELFLETTHWPGQPRESERAIYVSEVDPGLLDAFIRLLRLLSSPRDIPVLAPLIKKEICYRLLVGEQGPRLRQIISETSRSNHISKAIEWLKENYAKSIRVDWLASLSGMSQSNFFQQFRSFTALSPLQYQKKLRLIEARRIMLEENKEVANAAFQVGYESPSQFSRDYARLFGASPRQDLKSLHDELAFEPAKVRAHEGGLTPTA
ncbi:MAG: AraC family transcriptional regulator [Deltaproteobacteria bacterium]|jgi:AraC-like DNA-binding protein|nr:AraC family transcriptional regulator [Deltaproteobacteria bacterium]